MPDGERAIANRTQGPASRCDQEHHLASHGNVVGKICLDGIRIVYLTHIDLLNMGYSIWVKWSACDASRLTVVRHAAAAVQARTLLEEARAGARGIRAARMLGGPASRAAAATHASSIASAVESTAAAPASSQVPPIFRVQNHTRPKQQAASSHPPRLRPAGPCMHAPPPPVPMQPIPFLTTCPIAGG
jgi:hypothetical protein